MGAIPGTLDVGKLPTSLPIFPLTGVLLLPQGRLPLNIFEPRYLAMTLDAIATPDRLIGMIQPTEEEKSDAPPRVYPTGCAGRIVTFNETGDGRYEIVLAGIVRFNVAADLPTSPRGYRLVAPDYAPWLDDLKADEDGKDLPERPRLLALLKDYFARNKIGVDWKVVQSTPDARLITTLAMSCPFSASEKQAMLEARDLAARARVMIALIEMATMAHGAPAGAKH